MQRDRVDGEVDPLLGGQAADEGDDRPIGEPEASAGCSPLVVVRRSEVAGVAGVRDDQRAVASETVQTAAATRPRPATAPRRGRPGGPAAPVIRRWRSLRIQRPGSLMLRYTNGHPVSRRAIAQAGRVEEPYAITRSTLLAALRRARSVVGASGRRPNDGIASLPSRRPGLSAVTDGGEAACLELRGQLGRLDLRSPAVVGRRDDEHRRALPWPQPRATAPSWPHDEQPPVPPEEEGVLPPRGACPGDDGTQAEVADPPRGSMARVRLRSGRRPLPGERSVGPTIRHPLAQQLAGGARESVVDQGRLGVVQLLPGRAGPPAEIDVLTGEGERLVEATEGAEHGPLDSQGAAVPPRSHGALAQAGLLCEVPWRSMPAHR